MPQQQPQPDRLVEKSYQRLEQVYDMPPYEDYVKSLETPEGRQKAWKRLSAEYEMPFDFQTFDSAIKSQLPRSPIEHFVGGFKLSNIGLALHGVPSDVPEPQTFTQRIAAQAGTLLGDLPSMILGGALAAPSRNPSVIAGASFAAPEAIRQAQLEFMEKGTTRPFLTRKDLSELAARAVLFRNLQPAPEYNPESIVGSLLKTAVAGAKGFGVGAATAAAGAAAPVGLKTAAEIGTVSTLPRLLEGELPTAGDVAEAAVLVGGLRTATRAATQLSKKAAQRAAQQPAQSTEQAAQRPAKQAASYAEQFKEATEIARSTVLVTRGLDENTRVERLKEALKDYDPIVSEEFTNPRRQRGGPTTREERAGAAVEPDEISKPFVDRVAEASKQVSNLRAQIDAIKEELGRRSVTIDAVTADAEKAAAESTFSLDALGLGLEVIATPEKIPTFDFSDTPTNNLVQMAASLKTQLSRQEGVLREAKRAGNDVFIEHFFQNKAQGKPAVPLRGVTSTGEVVAVKVNRARSANVSERAIELFLEQQRRLAAETEGTLVMTEVGVPKPVPESIRKTLDGIAELWNGEPFSQTNYDRILPRLREVWKAWRESGRRFDEFKAEAVKKFGEEINPYLARYRSEVDSSDFVRILSEATLPGEGFVQLDASASAIRFLSPEQAARTAGRGFINSTGRKAPLEVNLQTPGVQDLTSFVIGSEGKALELTVQHVSYFNRVRREAFAGAAGISPRLVADPGRPILGLPARKLFGRVDDEIVHATKQRYLGGRRPQGVSKVAADASKEVTALVQLLDRQLIDYANKLTGLGEKRTVVREAVKKLVNLRNKAFGTKNTADFWHNLEVYVSAHAKTTTIDPVAKAIKRYMDRAGKEAFPNKLRDLIHDQIIDAKGRVWVGDRVADSIVRWFTESRLAKKAGLTIDPGARPFSRLVGATRSAEAKMKLGYRPIAAAVNGLYAFYKPLVKTDGPMYRSALAAVRWMKSPEGMATLEEETYHGSLGISTATDTSGKPIRKQSLLSPLGLWMAVEPAARRFNFSVAYLDALKRGMPEAAAKEFARRMVRLTNLTYVMSATPRIMRSPTARIVTQFKRFISGEFEFMHSLSPREWARYAVFQSLLVGPRGALLFIKSIPVLAAVGLLDRIEEQINQMRLSGGLPNLLNVDLGPAATLQLPTRPEDAWGIIVGDIIRFYKEIYSPALNPELSAEGKVRNAIERLPEFALASKNWMDLVEASVDADGWVLDGEGNRMYRLDTDYERFLTGVLGASTVEKSRIQTAQSIAIRDDKRKDEALRILSRRLRREFALTGKVSDSLIDDMVRLGISDTNAIEDILENSKLPPDVRLALRARLRDKAKVFELFRPPDRSSAPSPADNPADR